ncbi:MAG: hypothetical protein LQ350_006956 [Teloschistes chrysophthalmus]|nr:MAG: hypothetical protein LQ350_006956 [Niorma chrysophthalma]
MTHQAPRSFPFVVLVLLAVSVAVNGKTTSTLASSPATSTTAAYADDNTFRSDILSAHNTHRTSHNASAPTWNTTLASSATTHAEPCQFVHTPTQQKRREPCCRIPQHHCRGRWYSPAGNVEGGYKENVQKEVKDKGAESAGLGKAVLLVDGLWAIGLIVMAVWGTEMWGQ